MYCNPEDTEPGTSLGKIVFVNRGEGEWQGDLAGITAGAVPMDDLSRRQSADITPVLGHVAEPYVPTGRVA